DYAAAADLYREALTEYTSFSPSGEEAVGAAAGLAGSLSYGGDWLSSRKLFLSLVDRLTRDAPGSWALGNVLLELSNAAAAAGDLTLAEASARSAWAILKIYGEDETV